MHAKCVLNRTILCIFAAMTELFRHIESLLLTHNCVIVPHLGGFVTQYVAARYIEEEHLFLPPHRSVAFNPQLTLNDGLLVQSYMRIHSTTYRQTVHLIDDAVNDMKHRMQTEGCVELHGIGKLSIGLDGRYDFEPSAAGVTAPELFGLSAYNIERAESTPRHSHKIAEDGHYHLRINRELANYVAAAIVGILFYFAWALPEHRDARELSVAASIIAPKNITSTQRTETAGVSESEHRNHEECLETKKPVPEEKAQEMTAHTDKHSVAKYTIVLATGVPEQGANELVRQLAEQGFKLAEIVPYRHSKKVIYGTFASEAEAHEFINAMRGNSHFRDAWFTRR